MARTKEKPKPLFAVKHDFYASLDNLAHEGIMLLQAIEMLLKNSNLPKAVDSLIRERVASFRAALSDDDYQ